jgi:ATP-binding cassette subfamily B (MDR/TAP) protein 1
MYHGYAYQTTANFRHNSCNVIGQVVTKRYRLEMVRRMLSFDQDFFDRPQNSSGSLTSKLSSVPTSLQELISANVM